MSRDLSNTVFESSVVEEPLWKNRAMWFVLVCVWARLATIYMHSPFFNLDANFPYYLLNYKLEFTPRATIGSIYELLRNLFGIGWKAFCILRFSFCALVYSIAAIVLFRALLRLRNLRFAVLFGLFIFALPSTFHPMAVISVFDIYIITIMLSIVWMTFREDALYYVLVPPLCVLAVLTHENFIFMYLPFILGILIWRSEKLSWRGLLKGGLTFVFTMGAFAAMAFRRAYLHDHSELLEALNNTLSERASEYGIQLSNCLNTLGLTYWEHIKSVWSHFFLEQFSPYQIAVNVMSFLILVPAGIVIFKLWQYAWRNIAAERRRAMLCLIISCFGASCLFVVAHDYIRWITAIFICNTVALVVVYSDVKLASPASLSTDKMVKWFCVCIFYLCLDPPTGICFSIADLLAYPIYKLCM